MRGAPFIFDKYKFDAKTGVLDLHYAFDGGPYFHEVIKFPIPMPAYNADVADRMFRLIFLLAGTSYYKTQAPESLVCNAFKLDEPTAVWMEKVYRLGLAEFAHRNSITINPVFTFDEVEPTQSIVLDLPDRILVPVGGGKDSIVTLETLRDMKPTLFALGGPKGAAAPIAETINVSGMPSVYVSRTLSSNLVDLNKDGALNGHVPITAILSAIALACAVLYGFNTVVMSNEHSASAPNFDDVNHQYSKSLEFEQELTGYVRAFIASDLNYFSFLRPLTEIDIARRFAKLEKYHNVFRSCNTAFKQDEILRGKKWCCNCPKCRFVFLALAPFMKKAKLVQIFGANLLDEKAQLEGFEELCGASGHKPFECVGEVGECAAVIEHLSTMREWQDDLAVELVHRKVTNADFDYLFRLKTEHALPFPYLARLHETN